MALLGELTIDGKNYSLDDLTLDQLESLEDYMSLPLSQVDMNSARAMKFVVYLAKSGEDPAFTLEDAGKVRVAELISDDEPEEVPPTTGADGEAGVAATSAATDG